jgi:hypothetical protein
MVVLSRGYSQPECTFTTGLYHANHEVGTTEPKRLAESSKMISTTGYSRFSNMPNATKAIEYLSTDGLSAEKNQQQYSSGIQWLIKTGMKNATIDIGLTKLDRLRQALFLQT